MVLETLAASFCFCMVAPRWIFSQHGEVPPPEKSAWESISPDQLLEDINVLASDKFEG